ncbi:DUF349 domain-containing protein [Larsenimonas rhizosphaerae]|uniref:DUF349 domain-containing protein n=1 Tax=Larsenimonas rhizosphaerae TaxID=2944682 RepID=UPI0020348239|nr:DUF349 domain-containing protein [Larsenimonas rhizosphaerae]MCM2131621.1 DUF349 domain-containing protein [Larsenimonas rhizosphaerae]
MLGFFNRFFAPAWRHPDPQRRRQAIDSLDPQQDRETLTALLNDDNAQVRDAALFRLDDPELMLARLDKQQNDVIQTRLIKHLNGTSAHPLPIEKRKQLLELISEQALLKAVASNADNQQLRLAALARIRDEKCLIEQACQNRIAAVRHAAAERVESDEGLEQLVRQSTRDRHIVRYARDRLNQRQQDAQEVQRRHEQREALIASLEKHATAPWDALYEPRHRHFLKEWDTMASEAGEEQVLRFQNAHQRCEQVIRHHHAELLAAQEHEQALNREREDRAAVVEALENALTHLKGEAHPRRQDIDSLLALRRLQAERWGYLSEHNSPTPERQARYHSALVIIDQLVDAWQLLDDHRADIEQALDEQDMGELARLRGLVHWPADYPLPLLMREVDTALETHQSLKQTRDDTRSREDSQRLEQQLDELDKLLTDGELQSATRLFDALNHRFGRLSDADRHRHNATVKRLRARLAELRDWRSFVASPKREHLCTAMEELAEQPMADVNKDQRHRQLVNEWRLLGNAAATRELSQRFRTASDRIRSSLADYYTQLGQQREENRAFCEALCTQLEELIAHADQRADPDALRTIRNKAREEWRQHTPLPRQHVDALKHRFGLALQSVQALIDQQAHHIAEQKRTLAEQAEALLVDTRDIEQRTREAKDLQQQWRSLGRAPKGEEQRLWKQFRQACDQLFAWRDDERKTRRNEQDSHLDDLQTLIDRIDNWHPNHASDAETLDQAEAEFNTFEPLPRGRRSEGMRKRWRGIVRQRRDELHSLAHDVLKQRWHAWRPLFDAHVSADDAALADQGIEDVSLVNGTDLDSDARQAHQHRNLQRRQPVRVEDDTLQRLRVHLALMANAPIDDSDNDRRLDIQVARLNDNVGQIHSLSEEFARWLCSLLATGPVSHAQWEALHPELDALIGRLDFED